MSPTSFRQVSLTLQEALQYKLRASCPVKGIMLQFVQLARAVYHLHKPRDQD